MSVTVLEQPTIQQRERALILRGLAGEWDNLIGAFSAHWDGQDTALLERFMQALIAPYVHPSNDGERAADLMRQLVTQVQALTAYVEHGERPDSLDDPEAYGNAPAEVLVALLEDDVNDTIWELMRGDVVPCRSCRRTHASVATWRASDYPRSLFCAEHRSAR